jgi:hypothetical protein
MGDEPDPESAPQLDDSLRLLVALAEAFETRLEGKQRDAILTSKTNVGLLLHHHALDAEAFRHVDDEMIDRLHSAGFIRIDYAGQYSNAIYVTEEGERVAAEVQRLLAGDPGPIVDGPADLTWEAAARPMLTTVYEAWIARGAPSDGVLTSVVLDEFEDDDIERAARLVALLVQGDYLARVGSISTQHGPVAVTVTERGLQVVAGWPATTGEAAAGALLEALDRAIGEAPDDSDRKSKLERLRQVALDVGQGTLTEVLKHVVSGGI